MHLQEMRQSVHGQPQGQHHILVAIPPPRAVMRLSTPESGIPQPFLMVTDPPYGVEYDPAWRAGTRWRRPACDRKGCQRRPDRLGSGLRALSRHVMYVWHAGVYAAEVAAGILATGFQIRAQIIWRKQPLCVSRGAYHWQHEPCLVCCRGRGQPAHWYGDRTQSTVWDVP